MNAKLQTVVTHNRKSKLLVVKELDVGIKPLVSQAVVTMLIPSQSFPTTEQQCIVCIAVIA